MVAATAYAFLLLELGVAPSSLPHSSPPPYSTRYVVKHRMDFCFPKAWDVRRLQLSLARKFLSLSERDRESRQNVDARYRLAIMETAEKVTGDAFSGFLGAISASFKLIISTIFMLVAAGEAAPHMFVVILIIIAVSFFILSLRTPGTWRLWKEGHTTNSGCTRSSFCDGQLAAHPRGEARGPGGGLLKQAISDALVGKAPCTTTRNTPESGRRGS